MPPESDVPTLVSVIGRNLRVWREAQGWTQSEVAYRCRTLGADWTQATVSAMEAGNRPLELGEFLVLLVALRIPPSDLVAGEGPLRFASTATAPAEAVAAIFNEEAVLGLTPHLVEPVITNALGRAFQAPKRIVHDFEARYRHPSFERPPSGQIIAAAEQEAERKAARRLGMTPRALTLAAYALWGRSLTDEREQRVGPDPNRARRGHVTRQLIEELRRYQEQEDI